MAESPPNRDYHILKRWCLVSQGSIKRLELGGSLIAAAVIDTLHRTELEALPEGQRPFGLEAVRWM